MWNNSNSKTVVNWKVQPAMDTEGLLETVTGLANDGETNDKGVPNLLQAVLMANKYSSVFRLAKPPFYIQKNLFMILVPLTNLLGYKPVYKKYFD